MSCGAWLSPASWRLDRTRFGRLAVIRAWINMAPKPMKKPLAMQKQLDDGKIVEDFVAAGGVYAQTSTVHRQAWRRGLLRRRRQGQHAGCPDAATCGRGSVLWKQRRRLRTYRRSKPRCCSILPTRIPTSLALGPTTKRRLKANGIKYEAYIYPKTNHGFHNDTTPRYDEGAAKLAWQRTIDHFNKTLKAVDDGVTDNGKNSPALPCARQRRPRVGF